NPLWAIDGQQSDDGRNKGVSCLSGVRAIVGLAYEIIQGGVSKAIGAGSCVRGIDLLKARISERGQNWNSIHNPHGVVLVPRGDERNHHAVDAWRRYCAGRIGCDLQRGVPQDDGDKNRKSIGRRSLDNWRMPWLAELPPSELSYASRLWMGALRGRLVVAAGLVLLLIVSPAVTH
ncbi:MAG: hypothetical protein WCB03_01090, partial [Rouxiella badensis]|uniref:hypothetical protein n=1 Tax=Rouxiella badensis TaxID=1646377 RepID=UPI003C41E79A